MALLLSFLPPSYSVKAEDDSTVTRGDYIYSLSADPNTGAVPAGFGTPESNGRIWTDKSVSVNNKHFDVNKIELINGYSVEEMENNDGWDLTLFTCNYGGRQRITLRCVRSV